MSEKYSRYNYTPKGKKIRSIYTNRLRNFTSDGQYKDINLPALYENDRVDTEDYIKLEVYSPPELKRPLFKDMIKEAKWNKTKKNESFGPSWSTHWFKINIKIPKNWLDKSVIEFRWEMHSEGLIYTSDGDPIQGLTGNGERTRWIIPKKCKDGAWHQFYIEASCNGMFGNSDGDSNMPPNPNRYFTLSEADLVYPNLEARNLFYDFWIIGDAARELDDNTWQENNALQIGNDIIDAFDVEDKSTVTKGREIAKKFLGEKINSSKVYENNNRIFVEAIGNCHIDTAWLWPYAETRRKIARSWANQLDLIERYPEYRFVASQAVQFKWLKEDYPSLFSRLQKKIKEGPFEAIGGSWVENDTNLLSGESFSRQFLLGQRFFEGNFGKRSKTYWLPDTFGYSPQVPQLIRQAGMTRFLTQKLSWNNINNFPNSTFNWVALDGSQVITHMPPDNTYTAPANFGDVNRALKQHKNLDTDSVGLLLYGLGDGGGGPTDEMIEKLRRCRGMSDTTGGLPRVRVGLTAEEFFDSLEKRTNYGKDLVSWVGELYLEIHRGTYTTHADMKRGNRMCEILLHDVEFIGTLASFFGSDYKYPKDEINSLWELVCLNQFHDILPGSAIELAYKEASAFYMKVLKVGGGLLEKALIAIDAIHSVSSNAKLVGINTLPWHRNAIVSVPSSSSTSLDSTDMSIGKSNVLLQAGNSPGLLKENDNALSNFTKVTIEEVKPGVFVMDNNKLRVTIEDGGIISSLVDLESDREIIPEGARANQFVLFDDQPLYWQAWDTEVFSLDKRRNIPPGTLKIVEKSPLKVSLLAEQKISENSFIKTTISLSAYIKPKPGSLAPDASFVEFSSEVHWNENCKFLKVEFPVNINNDYASYETQYGYVKRPTHYNTSWDVAKFEVCCHKWADYSENGYGVAIMNDSKYGFSTHGNVMRLSLLRAPKMPDAHADMADHTFRYAFFPHKGSLNENVIRAAYEFNYPVAIRYSTLEDKLDKILGTFTLDGDSSLMLSNIKRGEDDKDLPVDDGFKAKNYKSVIVRVYDSLGGHSRGTFKSTLPLSKVFKSNILEDEIEPVDLKSKNDLYTFKVNLRPFECATFKLIVA